ncbi:MAG: hypothetical protein QHJ82_14370, partial [Verrucomicrobiota bacterium]|nr:hypothetical protein [Verrucomicrobiota bacterium]
WALVAAKRLDAVGVGRREAFGVRQLAAALFFCPNNVPVPISHSPPRFREQTHSCTRWDQYDNRTLISVASVASVVDRLDLVLVELPDRRWRG